MTETFTQCPNCQTSFLISDTHIDAANGMVRCGSCLETFKAQTVEEKATLHQSLLELENEEQLEMLQAESIAAIHEEPIEVSHSSLPAGSSLKLRLALCLLLLILAGQILWFNLDKALQVPQLAPLTNILCEAISCPEKDRNNIDLFVTEEIVVRSHPLYSNALQVDFIFNNESSFEQNFPLAELSFTDPRGQLLAQRLLTSREYLPENLKDLKKMPAGSKIQTSLEIVDPGQGATNYSLEFK